MANVHLIDDFVSREHRFTLGRDRRNGRPFLSTPVSGALLAVEYEAYFWIEEDQYQRFRADPEAAAQFTDDCRMGRHGARLIARP
ncbi:hypothetical protein [uncultured Devosia sp.]|uniref:hypothetical protein n=1 Tax=uncultured Devosia sp. TaxID=211434 RepID=UPI0035CAC8BB